MNVSEIIRGQVEGNPNKTAIIFQGKPISYGELDRMISRFSSGLQSLGLERGDVLSIFLPSLPAGTIDLIIPETIPLEHMAKAKNKPE